MLHACLGSEPGDPTFAAEEPSAESLGILTATVDEEIERIFLELPDDVEALEPIRGRGEEVRELLRMRSQAGSIGKLIRHHGDYHLGQVLWNGDDWVVLDFEGEPARSIPERRRKRSPLRDVAGMLRSFAYAVSAAKLQRGVDAPEEWEQRAREEFLDGYYQEMDATGLLPGGHEATNRILSIFELEKAVYELRYELNNRPDWVRIPVAGIERLLRVGWRRCDASPRGRSSTAARARPRGPARAARRAPVPGGGVVVRAWRPSPRRSPLGGRRETVELERVHARRASSRRSSPTRSCRSPTRCASATRAGRSTPRATRTRSCRRSARSTCT